MSAVPANTDTIAFLPIRDAIADRINTAGNFMARDPRILKPRPETLYDEDIAWAHHTQQDQQTAA